MSSVTKGRSSGRLGMRKKSVPYLMLMPTLVIICGFMLYPIVNTFALGFQESSLMKPGADTFIGFDNFIALAGDEIFWKALWNSFFWTVANVLLQFFFGLLLALILNRSFHGRGICRALAFTPWAVGGMLVAIMWSFMFNESIGVINDLLSKVGILDSKFSWFSNKYVAMMALVIANTWRGIPFFAVSILSSLQTISGDLYESADVDGAGVLRKFFRITMPLIKDTVILTTLLRTIWTLNVVDIIYGMTRGGPNFSTLTIPVYIMTTFNDSMDVGYSSAMAVVMTLILLLFSGGYLKFSRFGKENYY